MEFSLTLIPFTLLAVFILAAIYKSLTAEKTMQSVYWLIFMLVAVGFIFLLANSEILFAYQLMVYSGGIAVLMLFAGLLTEQDELFIDSSIVGFIKTSKTQVLIFIFFAIDVLALLLSSINGSAYEETVLANSEYTYTDSAHQIKLFASYLWNGFAEVIILLGFLLLTAILGSVKLAIRETDLEELSDEYLARIATTSEDISSLPGMEDEVEV